MAKPVFQNHWNVVGYDCEFVQRPPDFLQTDCSVCLPVLRSAHISTCCGHNFCKECIGRIHKYGKRCPLCNGEGFSLTYNRAYDMTLKQLEVYCTHRNAGCGWKGKLESLDEHLNVKPELEKLLEGCDLVEVLCYHDGCGQPFQRCLISQHQLKECPWRPYSCEHCHEYDSTYHDTVDNHWPVCECYPVSCPYKCTTDLIERQNLDKHLNEECPLQEVECDFKSAGCQTKLPRKDMPGHLKENVGHITLLARQNQELMAKLLEKEEEMRRMNEERQREMRRMNEESRREMAEIEQQFQALTKDMRQRISDLESKALEVRQVGAPVDLVMPNFERHRKDNDWWYSDSFYTHPQGYRMCLAVYAGGSNDARGTHVSS